MVNTTAESTVPLLRELVEHYISVYLYDIATFYAERLYYEQNTSENLHYVARCYDYQGKTKQVYHILQGDTLPCNRYLFAKTCIALNKFEEAETALLGDNRDLTSFTEERVSALPGGAAGLFLLGTLCRREQRKEAAQFYFLETLKYDKTSWGAYVSLCDMGYEVQASEFFGLDTETAVSLLRETPVPHTTTLLQPTRQNIRDTLEQRQYVERVPDSRCSPSTAMSLGLSSVAFRVSFATPNTVMSPSHAGLTNLRGGLTTGPSVKSFPRTAALFDTPGLTPIGGSAHPATGCDISHDDPHPFTAAEPRRGIAGGARRVSFGPTARLSFSSAAAPLYEEESEFIDIPPPKMQRRSGAHETPPFSRNKLNDSVIEEPEMVDESICDEHSAAAAPSVSADQRLFSLLTVFGTAYYYLSQYRCDECIRLLHLLPRQHFSSGWVQHAIGKAYFETANYKAAQLSLREMMRLEPYRVKGTEILSTALWHLRRDKELSSLAQQVVQIDKFCPEAWCVVGNCFSLQKEHESAIKFFDRAIQIDSTYAYAHTLCGHEYVCNEDLDKALASFRNAIRHDDRHYNAWYGLGAIFYRQERLELAECHFRRAVSINSRSSVLYCYLAMVLNAFNIPEKNTAALALLRHACTLDPKNPQLHFQLATVLCAAGTAQCLYEAMSELRIVKEYAPKEPPVFTLLGQLCHKLGRNQEALRYFNTAIDLDPKQANILKTTLEMIQDPALSGTAEDLQMLSEI